MSKLQDTARSLLDAGEVKVAIGYGEGSVGRVRPLFVTDAAGAQGLIYDGRCTQNLAVYTYKKETAAMGKPAVTAGVATMRALMRLVAERQLREGDFIALAVVGDEVTVCRTLSEMENWLAAAAPKPREADMEMIARIEAMTPAERWAFWRGEMDRCFRCYACRQACPLCYCTQCTVEVNQPQWIPVGATVQGNLEWHAMRAMHLAGRCIECGQCGDACPVDIPIHLLTVKLAADVRNVYGAATGMARDETCAMSIFKPDDRENFIG
ncbi:MAG: 4Fe-4S dicluster domain-containing protein [Rikenellaceae bacterium]|jgi:ferredoxin|nr:4Fe-4S dicluster domain-containing protein [Rikenellaceae bacterium]